MKYSMLAAAALLLPPQALMVQACDTSAQGMLDVASESETWCHPWPGCTSWTSGDTIKVASHKRKSRTAKADSADVLVGAFDLSSTGEFVRVELRAGATYRVEFTAQTGNLQVRPRLSYDQSILPLTVEDIPRASGTRAIAIVPRQHGEYDFRATGLTGYGARLVIFREAH